MGITVTFAGLMLICLAGDKDCQATPGKNTAWVVKAYPVGAYSKPCGWDSKGENRTRLVLRFKADDFDEIDPLVRCDDDDGRVCFLPEENLTLQTVPALNNLLRPKVVLLPRLYEIDERFVEIRDDAFGGIYAPSRIDFPYAEIDASDPWSYIPDKFLSPTSWLVSDGRTQRHNVPFQFLSDQLKAKYADKAVTVRNASGLAILTLVMKGDEKELKIVNETEKFDGLPAEVRDGHNDLAYLLWYYELGYWKTRDTYCPYFGTDANLLCCYGDLCNGNNGRKTTFWPVMRNARP